MYQLQPASDSGGRHLSSERSTSKIRAAPVSRRTAPTIWGRYIEDKGCTYWLEGGTRHPGGGIYDLWGGISEIIVVPVSWRAAPVSRRVAPMIRGAVYQR